MAVMDEGAERLRQLVQGTPAPEIALPRASQPVPVSQRQQRMLNPSAKKNANQMKRFMEVFNSAYYDPSKGQARPSAASMRERNNLITALGGNQGNISLQGMLDSINNGRSFSKGNRQIVFGGNMDSPYMQQRLADLAAKGFKETKRPNVSQLDARSALETNRKVQLAKSKAAKKKGKK